MRRSSFPLSYGLGHHSNLSRSATKAASNISSKPTHSKRTLQQSQNRNISHAIEACEVLEILKDKASRLLMVVASKYDDNDDEEGHNVPDHHATGHPIQQIRPIDIHRRAQESDEICQQDGMPPLNDIIRKGEIGHAEDKIRRNEIVRRAHSQDP